MSSKSLLVLTRRVSAHAMPEYVVPKSIAMMIVRSLIDRLPKPLDPAKSVIVSMYSSIVVGFDHSLMMFRLMVKAERLAYL